MLDARRVLFEEYYAGRALRAAAVFEIFVVCSLDVRSLPVRSAGSASQCGAELLRCFGWICPPLRRRRVYLSVCCSLQMYPSECRADCLRI